MLRPILFCSAVLIVAGCGSSSSSGTTPGTAPAVSPTTTVARAAYPTETSVASTTGAGPTGSAAATPSATGSGETLALGTTKLGKVMVDLAGFTLYVYSKDTSATASACTGACATTWLAVTGPPTAGPGLDPTAVTTFLREDGANQLAYKGHPLYYFSGDQAPGDTLGQNIDGVWFAIDATGVAVTG